MGPRSNYPEANLSMDVSKGPDPLTRTGPDE